MPDPEPVKTEPKTSNEGDPKATATSAGGDTGNVTTTQASTTTAPTTEGKFTQEDVNRMVGAARQEARDRTLAQTLQDLGLKDFDSLKTIITNHNEQRQAQMSELEKAQERLNELEGIPEKYKEAEKQIKTLNDLIEKQVSSMMETLEIPEHVTILLASMPPTERLSYLTEHGSKFTQQAKPQPPNTDAGSKGNNSVGADGKTKMARIKAKYGINY